MTICSAEKIPSVVRLIPLWNAYETITSMRSYKEGMSHETVCLEQQENAGLQFSLLIYVKILVKQYRNKS